MKFFVGVKAQHSTQTNFIMLMQPYYHILRLRADLLVLKVLLDVLLSSPRRPRSLIIPIVWFHSNNLYKLITTR